MPTSGGAPQSQVAGQERRTSGRLAGMESGRTAGAAARERRRRAAAGRSGGGRCGRCARAAAAAEARV